MTRYDGHADHYDAAFTMYGDLDDPDSSASCVVRLLGPGGGVCIDLGCGTGLHHEAVERTGRWVAGVDMSADQLRVAASRGGRLVRADATATPFRDACADAAVSTFVHTDVDDIAHVFAEAARVLRPGGRLVYVGVHPCFVGHFAERLDDGGWAIHPGYREEGWRLVSDYWGPQSIRRRVGERHVTLSTLVNALTDSGLRLVRMEEVLCRPLPLAIAMLAAR